MVRGAISLLLLCSELMGAAQATPRPLAIPSDFDRSVDMIVVPVDGQPFHPVFYAAEFAAKLVANGTPEDIQLAEHVLTRVIECQDTYRDDAQYGEFRWLREDRTVEDLNAVEFVLSYLIPMMIRYQDRLPPATREAVLHSIRLGLAEIARLDVGLKYTNVSIMDITNSSLGGELLGDRTFAERGYKKFIDWIAFTDQSGGIYEYNSIPYTALDLLHLGTLAKLTKDPTTRVRAKLELARIALSIGLHIDPATGRWAGPYGRAYFPSVTGEPGAYLFNPIEAKTFGQWIDDGLVPAWLRSLLTRRSVPYQMAETASLADGIEATTYFSKSFVLGVASRNLADNQANRFIAWQSDPFVVDYVRPGEKLPGSVFSRYVVNDEWRGDFSPARGRSSDDYARNVGYFQGVQDGNRAIALYAPASLGAKQFAFSAEAVVAWPRWHPAKDEAWIGEERITHFPAEVPRGAIVVVVSGETMIAMRPLTLTDLGRRAPIRLTEKHGMLLLEMYNYLGPKKTFWELANPGDFYHGAPQCGFYAEVAERSSYPDAAAFVRTLESGTLTDEVEPVPAYNAAPKRIWSIQYARDGRTLGIAVDLMNWFAQPHRWTQAGETKWSMLESPWAREGRDGIVQVRKATLKTARQPAWLFASPDGHYYVAGYDGPTLSSVELELPVGHVSVEKMSTGLIVWDDGKVTIDAIGLKGTPTVRNGILIHQNKKR